MENFVNKIKTQDGTEYSINDERVPQILDESKGKFLKVNDEGNLEFADVPAGGTKLYKHTVSGFTIYGSNPLSFEFISNDNTSISTFSELQGIYKKYHLSSNYGKVNGLISGVAESSGKYWVSLSKDTSTTLPTDTNAINEITISTITDTVTEL